MTNNEEILVEWQFFDAANGMKLKESGEYNLKDRNDRRVFGEKAAQALMDGLAIVSQVKRRG